MKTLPQRLRCLGHAPCYPSAALLFDQEPWLLDGHDRRLVADINGGVDLRCDVRADLGGHHGPILEESTRHLGSQHHLHIAVPVVRADATESAIHIDRLTFQNLEEPASTDEKASTQPVPPVELVGDGDDIGEGRHGQLRLGGDAAIGDADHTGAQRKINALRTNLKSGSRS